MRAAGTLTAGLLAALWLLGAPSVSAQDGGLFFGEDDETEEERGDSAAESKESTDESTPEYLKALELQRKGKFSAAQKALQRVLKKYPDSVHKADIEDRSGENHFAGCERLHESGPSSRRIDVAVMGDGFTVAKRDQQLERDWAELCLKVLYSEKAFDEYRDYFNYYFVRLVSEDEKVDPNITEAQKARIDEKNKRRAKKRKYDYSTALDCKAAGPQGQVMADRRLVYKWLEVADRDVPGTGDDGIVIAFARFGKLGMGGGGVANVGRPDKSVTVHEFGHAFVGLLDEYTNNPGTPRRPIRAPNATSDPENIPWQHFLDAKVKGVGVYEGGATFVKGVWRPARSCAMNSAGNTGFCPVCREAAVLAIYRYVSPIDTVSPGPGAEINVLEGDEKTITVTPMQPLSHDLDVAWFVETIGADEPGPDAEASEDATGTSDWWQAARRIRGWNPGDRAREKRAELEQPPAGDLSKLGKPDKRKKGEPQRHHFALGELPPGRYRITAQVTDDCKWVLKDEKKLLEERETWWVTVSPRP